MLGCTSRSEEGYINTLHHTLDSSFVLWFLCCAKRIYEQPKPIDILLLVTPDKGVVLEFIIERSHQFFCNPLGIDSVMFSETTEKYRNT